MAVATATQSTNGSAPADEVEVFNITQVYRDSSQVTDVKTFERVFSDLVPTLADLYTTSAKLKELKVKLAEAMILIRSSITFKGLPDWYGQSFAYQTAFSDRMRPALVEAGVPGDQIDGLLAQARTNHLNANKMLTDAIIRDAIHSGDIKDTDAAKYTAAIEAAGSLKNVDASKLPASVKKAANKAAQAAKKSEPFPASPKDRNNSEEAHENPLAIIEAALADFESVVTRKTEEDGPVPAPIDTLNALYASLTSMSDVCTGGPGKKAPTQLTGGKANISAVWAQLGNLCNSTAAYMIEKGTKESVDEHRYSA